MRSENENTEYRIANNSEVLDEDTLSDSSASSENLTSISEPIHRNFQHLYTNTTLPVEYLVPDDLDIYRLQNEYKDLVIPDLKDVICHTPQKVFRRKSIAKEYFQLMLAQNEIMESPEWSRYCKKQLS